MHFEMRESLKQKMLSLFRFKASSEYCLLHKRNGEKCVVQITSAGLASVAAFDEKGKRLIFIMSEIEKVEAIDQIEVISDKKAKMKEEDIV